MRARIRSLRTFAERKDGSPKRGQRETFMINADFASEFGTYVQTQFAPQFLVGYNEQLQLCSCLQTNQSLYPNVNFYFHHRTFRNTIALEMCLALFSSIACTALYHTEVCQLHYQNKRICYIGYSNFSTACTFNPNFIPKRKVSTAGLISLPRTMQCQNTTGSTALQDQ